MCIRDRAGSATMTGGHGTGLVFADEFEKVLGLQGAQAAAIEMCIRDSYQGMSVK